MTDYDDGYTSIEGGDRDAFPFQVPGEDAANARPNEVDKFPVEPAPRFQDEKESFRLKAPVVQVIGMIPKRFLGMLQKLATSGTKSPSIATYYPRVSFGIDENLTFLIHTLAQNQIGGNDPFAGVDWNPGSGGFPSDLKQSIVATAYVQMGAAGIVEDIHFNAPSDQLIRIPLVGQQARVFGAIEPRYYLLLTAPMGADYSFTWISTASNSARNNRFNNPPPGTVAANGPVPPTTWPPEAKVQIRGYPVRGIAIPPGMNSSISSRPVRRFSGWIDKSAAQGTMYRCPVARGAVGFTLLSDVSGAAVAAAGLSGQLLNAAVVSNGAKRYNFQPNVYYQLSSDTEAIDVYPSGGAVPNARSIPFEIVYDLGF